jgi:hypothetical protein
VLGASVGWALIAEQLPATVGVLIIVGITRTSGVGVVFVSDAQALRMKIHTLKTNKLNKDRFMGFSLVGQAFCLTLALKTTLAGYKPTLRGNRFLQSFKICHP